MSEKFTKGPWKATYDSQLQAAIEIYNTEDRIMVAVLPDRGTVEAMSEIEANANLIAAAPDMYEALKEVVALVCDSCLEYERFKDLSYGRQKVVIAENPCNNCTNKVVIALRKARGEEE
jgi:hypothetical protein